MQRAARYANTPTGGNVYMWTGLVQPYWLIVSLSRSFHDILTGTVALTSSSTQVDISMLGVVHPSSLVCSRQRSSRLAYICFLWDLSACGDSITLAECFPWVIPRPSRRPCRSIWSRPYRKFPTAWASSASSRPGQVSP